MANDKIRRRFNVLLVEVAIRHSHLVSHHDGIAGLVELRPKGVGGELAVE